MAVLSRLGIALAVLSISTSADAQLFEETFEEGAIDGGTWAEQPLAQSTVTVTGAAAHRGAFGLRIQDTGVNQKGVFGTRLAHPLGVVPAAIYGRMWVRQVSFNGQGDGISFVLLTAQQGVNIGALVSLGTNFATDLQMIAQTYDQQGAYHYQANVDATALEDGGWQLLETAVTGVNTDAGYVRAFLNGTQVTELGPLANFPNLPSDLDIGEWYINNGGVGFYQGIVDLDDLRVDLSPLPSALAVDAGSVPAVGECVPLTVGLVSTSALPDGGKAIGLSAPYDIDFGASGAAFFVDGACAQPADGGVLSRGASRSVLYAQFADAGPATVGFAQVAPADFLPATLSLTIGPPQAGTDAGADAGQENQSYFALQCGVGPGEAGLAALALIAFGLIVSRSRGNACARRAR